MNLYRLWALSSHGFQLLLAIGIAGALLGWRVGAYLMIAAVGGLIVSRCSIALIEYRRVMARPWPTVPPISGDDW